MMLNGRLLLGTGLTALIVGCGGGGGGGSNNNGSNLGAVPARAAITSENQDRVAAAAYAAGNAESASGLVQGAPELVGQSQPAAASAGPARPSEDIQDTLPCATGSIGFNYQDANDDDDIGSGDTFSIAFNNCVDTGPPVSTTSGTFRLSFSNVVSDAFGEPSSFTASVNMDDLRYVEQGTGEDYTLDGTGTYSFARLNATQSRVTMTAGDLRASEPGDVVRLSEPNLTFLYNEATGTATLFGTSVVSSSQLGGSFQVLIAESNPIIVNANGDITTGVIQVNGANDSKLTLTAAPNAQVRVQLDANGDGVFEQDKTIPIDDLEELV
jgi:hypothetical protein